MKKLVKPLIAIIGVGITIAFLPEAATAQRYRIRREIEKKYEKKYEEEHGEEGKAKGNAWLDNMTNVNLRESYNLTHSITYISIPYRKGEPRDNKVDTMQMFSNEKENLAGMRIADGKDVSYSITDIKEYAQITIFPAKKEMMAINAKAFMSKKTQDKLKEAKVEKAGQSNIKPNGKTKTILGYKCTGYSQYDGDEVTADFFISNLKTYKNASFLLGGFMNGFGNILESTTYKRGTITNVFVAIAENKNENLKFKTSEYKQLGFGRIE